MRAALLGALSAALALTPSPANAEVSFFFKACEKNCVDPVFWVKQLLLFVVVLNTVFRIL